MVSSLQNPSPKFDSKAGSRGWRRMREIAREDEAERQAMADGLVRDLGRTPSTAELLLIKTIAAQAVEGDKRRRQGKSSEMQDRLVYRGLTRLGIRAGEAKPESLEDYLRRTEREAAGASPACAESTEAEQNHPYDDARIGGHAKGEVVS